MRRPRGVLRKHMSPGGAGDPPGGTMTPRDRFADGRRSFRPPTKSAAPVTGKRRGGAPEGVRAASKRAPCRKARRTRCCASRRSASLTFSLSLFDNRICVPRRGAMSHAGRNLRSVGWADRASSADEAPGPTRSLQETTMANESTLSRPEMDDRIAILRDNIRQLTEQSAAASGAADEARNADRIAEYQDELDKLIQQRDALEKR